ncbi:MAG: cyclophilin-like fold protein [Halobacteriales archaeon]|nr:cyclophilin-like fold protein [Halobacteriales archaeon]
MSDLIVTVGSHELGAEWTEDNPETRAALTEALPLEGDASRWGDELYFRTPVDVPAENADATVPVGGIAYWPQGNAVCLFWGPTPASEGQEPRAASPVNLVAMLTDTDPLAAIEGGAHVRIEEA